MMALLRQIRNFSYWTWAALGLFVISILVLVSDSSRNALRFFFRAPEREILSVAMTDLMGTGQANRVVKVRTPDAILVEVYGPLEDDGRKLIDTIRLPDRRDGHYHLLGQAVNLALKDMDGDRQPEIVAPTYDAQLVPHLNVFKFNKEIQRFEPYQGKDP